MNVNRRVKRSDLCIKTCSVNAALVPNVTWSHETTVFFLSSPLSAWSAHLRIWICPSLRENLHQFWQGFEEIHHPGSKRGRPLWEQWSSLLGYHLDVKHKKLCYDSESYKTDRSRLLSNLQREEAFDRHFWKRSTVGYFFFQSARFWSHSYDVERFIVYCFEPWL